MNSKKYFISFASPDLKRSAERIYNQAQKLNFYDKVCIFSTNNLEENYKNFILNLIKKNKKVGYGYSAWKPFIINQFMKQVNNGDIIHYVDAGCHINENGKERLKFYIQKLNHSDQGILAFQYNKLEGYDEKEFEFPKIYEYKYTKADLLNYFNVLQEKKITHTKQYWAGNFFLKKNTFVTKFINEWIEVFEKRFDLIDDTPSKEKNFDGFIHNKSDQSVFSILCKKNSIQSISAYECEWFYHNNERFWGHTINSPIIAKRDLKYNIFKRFYNRQLKTLRRLKNFFKF